MTVSAATTAGDLLTVQLLIYIYFLPSAQWQYSASSSFARLLLTVARYDISLAIFR